MTTTVPRIPGHNASSDGTPRKAGLRVPDAAILEALWAYGRAIRSRDFGKTVRARRDLEALLLEEE
jgi:hypothetical protein